MSDNDIILLFREKGLRLTPQRMNIYRTLCELHHPTAEEVWEAVRKKIPAITVATIYNTLECLVSSQLAEKVFTLDNKMYFDADTRPHQHLYDNHSHSIADLHDEQLTGLILEHIKKNKQLSNFELQDIKIQLIGHYTSPEK